jgi:Tol biopolymer transport system component
VLDVATGASRVILPAGGLQFPRDWIDGAGIVYVELSNDSRNDIMTVSPKDRTPKAWMRTPFNETHARVSPDGKTMAFLSEESGSRELYVAPFDRPRDSVRLTTGGARIPAWSPDGREIYFLRGRREVFVVPVQLDGATEPVHLFTTTADILDYDVAPDGRILIAQADDRTEQKRLQVIVNWQAAMVKAEAK